MLKDNREYRSFDLLVADKQEGEEENYVVEGYASTFDSYVLFKDDDGTEYRERMAREAFDKADMDDVIFVIDHEGRVYARTKNGLIDLTIDDHGLKVRVDLGKTSEARKVYEDIKVGNYYQMSFAFTVEDDKFNKNNNERVINSIRKIYDISAVSFPANPNTEISVATRKYFDGVIEELQAERLESEKREKAKKALELRIKLGGYLNGN